MAGSCNARIGWLACMVLGLAACAMPAVGATAAERSVADFNHAAQWQLSATDDVTASLQTIAGPHGQAFCLDYDLNHTAGYATIRRALPITFPANYAFRLRVRGSGAANTLQLKFIDASGNNVWWHTWPDFRPPRQWTVLEVARRDIHFAWGPRKNHALDRSATLELTVAAGKGGGRGSVCFDALDFVELPVASIAKPPPPSLATNPNAFVEALARRAPRGYYPRGFSGQQVYWTLVGVDAGEDSGLLSEDGALEVGKGGFTIEPFLLDAGKLVTWADVTTTHSLADGYLPIPSATWRYHDLHLRVTAFAAGQRGNARLIARYVVRNDSDHARKVTLALAARPFQVDPPTQFLNAAGGVSAIHRLAWHDATLIVDGKPRVHFLPRPSTVAASNLRQGPITRVLAEYAHHQRMAPTPPRTAALTIRYASGAALYPLQVPAHGEQTVAIVVPLASAPLPRLPPDRDAAAWLQRQERAVATQWRQRLNRVTLRLPPAQQRIADTLRSSLAWILISRNGPELRPGTRSYARSWIRDGAMMSDALLRLGDADAARRYAQWYAPHQFTTGKVPCCVDARGPDPTPENDSPGELLHLIAQVYRYTHDRTFLATMWPHITATVAYAHGLIETQSGAHCNTPATRMFCGLLPASISHEGYSAHPEHSYWDDFWMLTGYRAAIDIARVLAKPAQESAWSRQRDVFRKDLYASIRASVAAHHIDYIPGSAELGDFDPTSTSIALEPGGQLRNLQHDLPSGLLRDTFERYWRHSLARADGRTAWSDYTPYEWRNVGVFARLGWRTRIPTLLDFLFAGVRPRGWNGWAEVVGREARKPRFVGDLPHAWIASDCIRATLDLFAFQRYRDSALVLAAGVQPAWLADGGIALRGLRTPWGELAYTLQRKGTQVVWNIAAGVHPPGGIVLTWPLAGTPGTTTVNGHAARWSQRKLRIHSLPATVITTVPATTGTHGIPRSAAGASR